MTLRSSFSDLLRENMKRRLWSAALSLLLFFFLYPVAALLSASRAFSPERAGTFSEDMTQEMILFMTRRSLHASWISWVSAENPLFCFLLPVTAMILSFSGFRYLQQRQQTDFFHSLPLSRSRLFLAVNLNSLLIVTVPSLVMGLLGGLIMQFHTGYADCVPATLLNCLLLILFFCLYSMTAVLAVLLTGNIVVCVLAMGVFLSWGPMLLGILDWMRSDFFRTAWGPTPFMDILLQYASPSCLTIAIAEPSVLRRALSAFAIAVLLFLLNRKLYSIRPSEAAEKAMAFPKTEAPVKCIITFTMGLAGAMFFHEIQDSIGWSFFGLFCGAALTHCIMEIIYRFDFRRLFARKRQLLLCLLLAAAVFSVYRYDLFGYDRYLPAEGQVESAGLFSDPMEADLVSINSTVRLDDSRNNIYPVQKVLRGEAEILREMALTDTGSVRRVAEQGIAAADSGTLFGHPGSVRIAWHLKNGRTVFRCYHMDLGKVRAELDSICEDPAFKTAVYPVLSLSPEDLAGINFQDFSGPDHVPHTARENGVLPAEAEAVLAAYRKDLLSLTAVTRRTEAPEACLQFKDLEFQETADRMRNERKAYFSADIFNEVGWYPVYPSFLETRKALEKCGVRLNSGLDPEKITVTLSDTTDAPDGLSPEERDMESWRKPSLTISDPEKIRSILDGTSQEGLFVSDPLFRTWSGVEILVRPGTPDEGTASGREERYFSFHADRVPEEVRMYFGITDNEDFRRYIQEAY